MKKFSKIACASLLAGITACTVGLSACANSRSEAKFVIEFNNETYELKYELHKNKYPQTVKHFIELADEGFYDNTIIHNYTTNDWYGGGYGYNSETYDSSYATSGGMVEYLENNSLEGKYYNDLFKGNKLSASVYKDSEVNKNGNFVGKDALPTLIGEFSKNGHVVENGALSSQLGALKMFYYGDKTYNGKTASEKIWMQTEQDEAAFYVDYTYNSATSIFAIQVSSISSLSSSEYCTFAILKGEKDKDVLNELKDAISEYIDSNHSGISSNFYKNVDVTVDKFEQIADKGTDASFATTVKPIVIKSVKITKF